MKARFNQIMDDQKRQVQLIEETISMTKNGYSDSLKELEKISEEIHQRRAARQQRVAQKDIGIREEGVGAEHPDPPPLETSNVRFTPWARGGHKRKSDQLRHQCGPKLTLMMFISLTASSKQMKEQPPRSLAEAKNNRNIVDEIDGLRTEAAGSIRKVTKNP
jgi:hypothetical protein